MESTFNKITIELINFKEQVLHDNYDYNLLLSIVKFQQYIYRLFSSLRFIDYYYNCAEHSLLCNLCIIDPLQEVADFNLQCRNLLGSVNDNKAHHMIAIICNELPSIIKDNGRRSFIGRKNVCTWTMYKKYMNEVYSKMYSNKISYKELARKFTIISAMLDGTTAADIRKKITTSLLDVNNEEDDYMVLSYI